MNGDPWDTSIDHWRNRNASDDARSGVYILWNGPELMYVGKTCNLRSRIMDHLRRKTNTRIQIVYIDEHPAMRGALEFYLISIPQYVVLAVENELESGLRDLVIRSARSLLSQALATGIEQ
jgi:hypothetical protein